MPTVKELERQRGQARREATQERREAVRRLTEAGLSAKAIGERLGVPQRLVVRDRHKLGIAQPSAIPLTPAEICLALNLLEDECPLGEIAATLGRGKATIARKFRGHSKIKGNPLRGCHELRERLGLL